MKNKIDSSEARDIYSKRMRIVEPVFANISFQKKLNYFTLRTKEEGKYSMVTLLYNS